jgi:uncharacterized protein
MSPLIINLRHIEHKVLTLQGQVTAEEMELETLDPLIHTPQPLSFALTVERLQDHVLVKGRLRLVLACECVRCLESFEHPVELEHWSCMIPLTGEEKAPVVNDCLDLTPYVREDILLAFPLHPLCRSDCGGIPYSPGKGPDSAGGASSASSTWSELNKLKF